MADTSTNHQLVAYTSHVTDGCAAIPAADSGFRAPQHAHERVCLSRVSASCRPLAKSHESDTFLKPGCHWAGGP